MLLGGLDIETTGLYQNQGHRIIQIGISVWDTELGTVHDYSSDIRPIGNVVYSENSLKVNGFTKARIKKAPSQTQVDTMIWGEMLRINRHDTIIPVGFNVIMFDMPFIKRELPLIASMFTYPTDERSTRAIDLMSIGLALEYKLGLPYEVIKREAKEYAEKSLGYVNHHDALFDAKAAIETLRFYKEKMGDPV